VKNERCGCRVGHVVDSLITAITWLARRANEGGIGVRAGVKVANEGCDRQAVLVSRVILSYAVAGLGEAAKAMPKCGTSVVGLQVFPSSAGQPRGGVTSPG
jgi:hypothetical protein